ncbi:hypothetical protein AVHY2522_17940 [Acidovorax sp. SUPP2522]|nr:hypothetical protein AVHY2522_17940 [Acidovorax sp. SUPP2522]
MTAAYGLRRQLVVSLAVMAIGIALLFLLGSYALFALLMAFSPSSISDDLTPSPIEAMWMLCTVLVALVLAVVTAVKLSRRIVVPLNSVAESLRRIAEGDLLARATTDDHSLGETAQLVRDFNSMAERLQHMAQQRAFWNAAIAHELRTPVTILRGRLQGMTEGVFEPTPTQFQGLLKNVEGLGRLIEDLRLLGLKDSGHLELHLELADLAAEVGAVAQAFEPQLRAAGFALTLDLNPQEVLCDPVRIRQALLALLENALRHATPGPMRIRHWVESEMCHLCVEDSGPGLNADDAARLFDAFQRGEASRRCISHSRRRSSQRIRLVRPCGASVGIATDAIASMPSRPHTGNLPMPWKNTPTRFGAIAKFFHWTSAVAFIAAYAVVYYVIWFMDDTLPESWPVLNVHWALGLLVGTLVLPRLLWRLSTVQPDHPPGSPLEHRLAQWAHWGLYGLLIAMPLTGYIGTDAPTDFGLFSVPSFRETAMFEWLSRALGVG